EGVVVRGVGGRRDEYRPVVSRLVDRPDPFSVARAFRDQLGLTRLYVADLDAILHQRPNRDVYRLLANEGFELMIDAGLRSVESGVATTELCGKLRDMYPDLRLITGGGVRDAGDVRRLAELGVDGVLVASALHDGAISGDCLHRLAEGKGSAG